MIYYDKVLKHLILIHLFVKVSQPGDSEVTFSVFWVTCYYQSNHSKVELSS